MPRGRRRSSDYPADMTSETADTAGAPGTVEAPATVAPSPPGAAAPRPHAVLSGPAGHRPRRLRGTGATRGQYHRVPAVRRPRVRPFFMRVSVVTRVPRPELEADLAEMAEQYEMHWALHEVDRPLRTLLMVSKEAHCLSDLLFRATSQGLPIDVVGVVGNHEDLRSVTEFYGASFHHIPVTRDTKATAESELLALVDSLGVELVVLARYMQILSPALCERLHGSVINIHHSFLPSFKGAKPYHQAHDRGVKLIGRRPTTSRPTSTRARSSSRTSPGPRTPTPSRPSSARARTSRGGCWPRR